MSIKGISLRYAEFITSLSIFKGTVNINIKVIQKNVKLWSYFWTFNSKFKLSTPLVFSFSDNFREKYYRNKSEI